MSRTDKRISASVEPEEILNDLLGLDPSVQLERYYGERSAFYNPNREAPLGVIFASVKEQDGPNDKRSNLSRPGVYRLALGLRPDSFRDLFGDVPSRPAKGEVVSVGRFDPSRLNELTPHPVYAWMSWVQILSPTRERFDSVRPLIDEALTLARDRWTRRDTRR